MTESISVLGLSVFSFELQPCANVRAAVADCATAAERKRDDGQDQPEFFGFLGSKARCFDP